MDWTRTVQVSSGRLDKLVNLIDHLAREAGASGNSQRVAETLRTLAGLETFPFDFLRAEVEACAESVSAKLGKLVTVEFDSGGLEIPFALKPALSTSFLHLVRNALAHGIESPSRRAKVHKPEAGRIDVRARVKAGEIEIAFKDDGAGPDLEALTERVIRNGDFPERFADRLSHEQKLEFLFRPGLSTSETSDQFSGRGIGMDAVAHAWKALGGRVSAQVSEQGGGLEVLMRAPLQQFSVEARRVEVGDAVFWIPARDVADSAGVESMSPLPGALIVSEHTLRKELALGPRIGSTRIAIRAGDRELRFPCKRIGDIEFRSFRRLDPSWSNADASWIRAWMLRFPRCYASMSSDELGVFASADLWCSLVSPSEGGL